MSIAVSLPNSQRGTTDAFGSARPVVGDYFTMSIGGVVSTYRVTWVYFTGTGTVSIGATLEPTDPPPPR